MKHYWASPDVQLRAVEWTFGLALVALIAGAFAWGWVGAVMDGATDWYTNLFTVEVQVAHHEVPPESAFEGYVPGASRSASSSETAP